MELILLGLAALFAGFVDAIVGGGGLVLVPALFSAFPDTTPATLFGTNKAGAIWGTSASMWSYVRRVRPPWSTVLPATLAAFVGALCGAWLITQVKSSDFRQALPFILLAVLLYTLKRKDLGHHYSNIYNLLFSVLRNIDAHIGELRSPSQGDRRWFPPVRLQNQAVQA